MRLDLHLHSTASDGEVRPSEVVRLAAEARLDVVALADHDTVAGVEEARAAGREREVEVIPAIEVSTTRAGRELHVLGYFVDPAAPSIEEHQERAVRLRHQRIVEMIRRLDGQGIAVSFDAVLEEAGPERSALGRPHLARAMVAAGHASNVPEAFNRWIGDEHTAFVPTDLGDPLDGIRTIEDAGGVAVWAHPPRDLIDGLLPELVRGGLRGIEVHRPRTRPDEVRRLDGIARSAGLLVSGGSDWHGPGRGLELGDFWVGADEVSELLEAGGM